MALDKNQIAQRIAQELEHNTYVNLGIGIPMPKLTYILSSNSLAILCAIWFLSNAINF